MRARAGLALAVALSLAGCGGEPQPRSALFVVIDTLRADHVGSYGYQRATTPAIDALAARATRFERAYSTSSWTQPAVASMLTGRYPSSHGANGVEATLAQPVLTLAELLGERDYRTAAVVSHLLLSAKSGFGQGFDTYLETQARGAAHVSTPGVTQEALGLLRELAEGPPFLLFVHYFDPHYHYRDHEGIDFAPERAGRLDGSEKIRRLRRYGSDLTAEERDFLRALYDEEIRFTDAGVGRLLEELELLGVADETVVVVTSDHGEEFLERGWIGHTRSLYEELVRVPLVIRSPDAPPGGRVVDTPVSLVDLAPTLLELLGVEAGELGFQGRSLAPAVLGTGPLAPRTIYAEVDYRPPRHEPAAKRTAKRAVIAEHVKLIRDELDQRVEIYDLRVDAGERHDLAARDPALVRELVPLLDANARRAREGAAAPGARSLDPEELELLRDLGYVDR